MNLKVDLQYDYSNISGYKSFIKMTVLYFTEIIMLLLGRFYFSLERNCD